MSLQGPVRKEASPLLWPEIWLEIFSYLSGPDLRNATLTHTFFCELAQPLLFREIALNPPTVDEARLARVERLEFVASPRIACAVTTITIRPASHGMASLALSHYQPSIRLIVQQLPFFPRLSTVVCERIRWSNKLIEDLAEVSQLHSLGIKDCLLDFDRGSIVSRLKVHNLTIESSDLDGFPVKGWSSVIDSHRTGYVVGQPASSIIISLSASPETTKSLISLESYVNGEEAPLLLQILDQSSHILRTLCVKFTDGPGLGPLPLPSSQHWPVAMPVLTRYAGPADLLSLVTTNGFLGNIRHLHLHEYRRGLFPSHSVPLLDVLSRFRDSESALETLDFAAIEVTRDLLDLTFCHQNLKRLTIRASMYALAHSTLSLQDILNALLTMKLPQQITSIEIYLRLDESLNRQKCSLLREKLQSKYPDFCHLLLDCRGQFMWQRENNAETFTCGRLNAECTDGCCLHQPPLGGYVSQEPEGRKGPHSKWVVSKVKRIIHTVIPDSSWNVSRAIGGIVSRTESLRR